MKGVAMETLRLIKWNKIDEIDLARLFPFKEFKTEIKSTQDQNIAENSIIKILEIIKKNSTENKQLVNKCVKELNKILHIVTA